MCVGAALSKIPLGTIVIDDSTCSELPENLAIPCVKQSLERVSYSDFGKDSPHETTVSGPSSAATRRAVAGDSVSADAGSGGELAAMARPVVEWIEHGNRAAGFL